MASPGATYSLTGLIAGDDLAREARRRKAKTETLSIPKGSPIPEGWQVNREFKTKVRLVREKSIEAQLRDKVWLLFFKMGVPVISGRDFLLELKGRESVEPFQPSVVAQDDEIVFVVIVTAQGLPVRKKRMQYEIEQLARKQSPIRTAIKKTLNIPLAKVVFVIATENIEWQESDRKAAQAANILVWDDYDILALEELTEIAGEGARYQVYNRVFYGKKIKAFEVRLPALKSKMGGKTYYSMAMTPEHLLKIAYVHQRSASSTFIDISETYQRVLDPKRVQEIRRYIREGGFFPNSVILNFTRPIWREERIGSPRQLKDAILAEPVMVTLPPYFGSAWIIDGQHRIYGYADSRLKVSETIPVVAFVEESPETQARIFLDINEKQKAIRSDLRWDLYEDIYLEATSAREQELYAISVIAKRLNNLPPLIGSIKIPAEGNKGHLSLTTLCRVIRSERFIDPETGPLNCGTILDSVEFAAQRIAGFFQVVADKMPTEWRAGPKHYVHTNAGIVVFLGILRDILDALEPSDIDDIEQFRLATEVYLEPVIKHLREAQPQIIERYRSAGGATGASRQIQARLTKLIASADVGFESRFLAEYEREQSARESARRMSLEEDRAVLLLAGESESLEIKGSLALDINRLLLGDETKERSEEVTREILSTIVGFLNGKRERGQLVIGAIETKRYRQGTIARLLGACPQHGAYTIIGIENDYNYRDFDQYELQIRDLVKTHITPDVEPSLDIEAVPIGGRTLAVITLKREPNRWCYLDNADFCVRIGNRTRRLTGREMDDYRAEWLGKTIQAQS